MKRRLLNGTALDLIDPLHRYLLLGEGDDDSGGGGGDDAGAADDAAKAEAAAAEDKGGDDKGVDWRAGITDEAAKKFAETSTDITSLAKRGLEMREKLSKSVIMPGKDASAEEVAAFNKALGVPDSPEGYEWPAPAEGEELTDDIKAQRADWSKFFHDQRYTKTQAEAALARVVELNAAQEEKTAAEDKAFADEQEAILRNEWPGDEFKKNKEMASRAARELFGDDFKDVMTLESKDGRLVMDNVAMSRVFARIGREMAEGGMNVPATETDAEAINGEIETLRKQQSEASASGDSKKANDLYQKEQDLIRKRDGNRGLVGVDGKAA